MRPCRPAALIATALLSLAPVLLLGACATQQEIVTQREDYLAAAGFIVRPANTPARIAMLQRLPPHRFVQRVRGDDVSYVYADPLVCGCLYVGSQQAYGRFRAAQQARQLADEQQMTAETYQDAAWNWGAWGPGFGPGFGPGLGW